MPSCLVSGATGATVAWYDLVDDGKRNDAGQSVVAWRERRLARIRMV
ncbi:MAG TPA: hypothetical protein VKB50_02515 [Vicinamibacterales bacterium]|nr:hypothetical protein [Vicinamibacterales bacterium]